MVIIIIIILHAPFIIITIFILLLCMLYRDSADLSMFSSEGSRSKQKVCIYKRKPSYKRVHIVKSASFTPL